jgi:hypothetical protein
VPGLTEELRRRIRELQESGLTDTEISKELGLSYQAVHYQRPEVRERRRKYSREYMRKYMKRPEVRERKKTYLKKYMKRPEVRERIRKYSREYHWKRRLESDPELRELLGLIDGVEVKPCLEGLSEHNVYVSILKRLASTSYGMKYRRIERDVGAGRIVWKLRVLVRLGLIRYEDHRYALSDSGRKLCERLF